MGTAGGVAPGEGAGNEDERVSAGGRRDEAGEERRQRRENARHGEDRFGFEQQKNARLIFDHVTEEEEAEWAAGSPWMAPRALVIRSSVSHCCA